MTITTLSSREFNQDASKAKHAAQDGPVIITDRGRPAHVLLTFAQYKKLTGKRIKIADLLAMPGRKYIEFEAPRLRDLAQPADFS
jgi:prevent-host-death family protein